ncbi:MAG: YchJ family protein [Nitrospiraceae bacterium]|nr:YchJ family protein [Nitrospiraceae bacterium]
MENCSCGYSLSYEECCGPVIRGERPAATAEQVMRARYSAYARGEIAYLLSSLHPDHRSDFDEKSTKKWAEGSEWHKLEIVETSGGGPEDSEGMVEFVASYTEQGVRKDHHERAAFLKQEGNWYFVSGEPVPPKQVVRSAPKVGRNDPCPCGSGKKFKKCCGK